MGLVKFNIILLYYLLDYEKYSYRYYDYTIMRINNSDLNHNILYNHVKAREFKRGGQHMSELFKKLQPHLDHAIAFQTARSLFEWDNETIAPECSADNTSKVIGIISNEYMNSLINDDVRQILKDFDCESEQKKLSHKEKAIVKEDRKSVV